MSKLAKVTIMLLIIIGIVGVVISTDDDKLANNDKRVSVRSTGYIKGESEAVVNEEGIRRIFYKPDDRIKIDLSNQGLISFPIDILHDRSIEVLDLANNEITKIPKQIRLLSNLQELHLSNNSISDLPDELSELTKLRRVILKNNPVEKDTRNKLKENFPFINFDF